MLPQDLRDTSASRRAPLTPRGERWCERIETLRQAFDATMHDPDFLAEMRSQTLEVRPVGGAEVQTLMRDIYASPPDVVKLARDILVDTP